MNGNKQESMFFQVSLLRFAICTGHSGSHLGQLAQTFNSSDSVISPWTTGGRKKKTCHYQSTVHLLHCPLSLLPEIIPGGPEHMCYKPLWHTEVFVWNPGSVWIITMNLLESLLGFTSRNLFKAPGYKGFVSRKSDCTNVIQMWSSESIQESIHIDL